MKKIYLLFIIQFIAILSQSQVSYYNGYSVGLPVSSMKQKMRPIHAFAGELTYTMPFFKYISVGFDFGIGGFGSVKKKHNIKDTSSDVKLTTRYRNISDNYNALLRFNFFNSKKTTLYSIVKIGRTKLESDISIEDPNSEDDCEMLEDKYITKDYSKTIAYGLGVKYKIGDYINENKKPRNAYVDFSITNIRGTPIEYINVKNLKEVNNVSDLSGNGNGSRPININSIDITSNIVHTHLIGELYKTPFRLVDVRLGLVIEF